MEFLDNSVIDKIELPPSTFDGLTSFTVSIWVRVTRYTSMMTPIISIANSSRDNEFSLNFDHVKLKGPSVWMYSSA